MPSPAAPGHFGSLDTHNNPGRLLFSPPLPRKDGEVPGRAGMPTASGLMLIPEAPPGLGIAGEMLAEPSAQVPLLRSAQRDPSARDVVWASTGSAEEDCPPSPVGRGTLQVAGTLTQAETHREALRERGTSTAQVGAGANAPSLGHWVKPLVRRAAGWPGLVLFSSRRPGPAWGSLPGAAWCAAGNPGVGTLASSFTVVL